MCLLSIPVQPVVRPVNRFNNAGSLAGPVFKTLLNTNLNAKIELLLFYFDWSNYFGPYIKAQIILTQPTLCY